MQLIMANPYVVQQKTMESLILLYEAVLMEESLFTLLMNISRGLLLTRSKLLSIGRSDKVNWALHLHILNSGILYSVSSIALATIEHLGSIGFTLFLLETDP